jgi:hypothetical protein
MHFECFKTAATIREVSFIPSSQKKFKFHAGVLHHYFNVPYLFLEVALLACKRLMLVDTETQTFMGIILVVVFSSGFGTKSWELGTEADPA